MRNTRRLPKAAEIAQLREALFPAASAGESRELMAEAVRSLSDGREHLSARSIQNAERGMVQFTSTLTSIAQALGVTLEHVSSPINGPRSEVDVPTGPLVHYGFGGRDDARSALLAWQRLLRPKTIRILAFTGHTLGLQGFLRHDTRVELLLGSKKTAHTMEMTRQEMLFDSWSAMEAPDLQEPWEDGRLAIYRHPCPPSFTAWALDDEVYLYNPHIWLPLAVADSPAQKEELNTIYRRFGIAHLASSRDPATLAGADLPCTLVKKGGHRSAQDAYDSISQTFEMTWSALMTVATPALDIKEHFVK